MEIGKTHTISASWHRKEPHTYIVSLEHLASSLLIQQLEYVYVVFGMFLIPSACAMDTTLHLYSMDHIKILNPSTVLVSDEYIMRE